MEFGFFDHPPMEILMENENAVTGALIFIALILGANFVMYGIARGAARSKGKGFWETFTGAMNTSVGKKNDDMDELRRKLEELQKGGKEE
jgi:hypothetical protein